jgi:transposase
MKAYSLDLRQRVLAAVDGGMPRAQVAVTYAVSLATIKRLLARRRAGDDLAPRTSPGRRRTIACQQETALWAQLAAHPDATVETHARLWNAARGGAVSAWTVGRAIRRLGWTRKKRHWQPPSGTRPPASSTARG